MATAQTQFYQSKIMIGGSVVPCFPEAAFYAPPNYVVPPILGNFWQVNVGVGLIQPYVELSFALRDKTSEVLYGTFLDYWFARSADVAHDTAAIPSGIVFWDGYKGWSLSGAKADSFSIGASKGSAIQFTARFCGTSFAAQNSDPAPGFVGWSTDSLLMFDRIGFDSNLTSRVWRFDASFSNNHNPDLSLDGTVTPAACNAGMQTAGFQITCQAKDDVGVVGMGTVADESAIYFDINGSAGKKVRFTMARCKNADPNSRNTRPPRIMRQYPFLVLGADGQTTPPLVHSIPGGSNPF